MELFKSTSNLIYIPMKDQYGTLQPGKTVTAVVSKDKGAFAPVAGPISAVGLGMYAFEPTAADLTAEGGGFIFSASGCVDYDLPFNTISGYTALRAAALDKAATALPNAAPGTNGGLPLSDASGGVKLTAAAIEAISSDIEAELADDATGGQFMLTILNKLQTRFDFDDLTLTAIGSAVKTALLNQLLAGIHDTPGTVGALLQGAATSTELTAARQAIVDALPDDYQQRDQAVTLPAGVAQTDDITSLQNALSQSLTDIGALLEFLVARNSDWIKEDPETYPGTGTVTYTKAAVPLVYNVAYDANKQVLSVTEAV